MNLKLLKIFKDKAKAKQRNCRSFHTKGKAKKRNNPCRNRSSDICTKNNSNGLCQTDNLGIYKTNHHYSSRTRRLNDCRNRKPGKNRRKSVPGNLMKQSLKTISRSLLNSVRKHLHSKKQEAERTNKS